MSDQLATILGSADSYRIEVQRNLNHPIDAVWDALINPDSIAQWFAIAKVEPREGGRIELSFGKTIVTGVIKTFMPPNAFAYTWVQEGEAPSLVNFDLIPIGTSETLLTVMQTAMSALDAPDVAAGWHTMMDRFTTFLSTGGHAPQDKAAWQEIYATYKQMVG